MLQLLGTGTGTVTRLLDPTSGERVQQWAALVPVPLPVMKSRSGDGPALHSQERSV